MTTHEVTRQEFFAKIGALNVHPQIVGKWPYTSIFLTPDRHERGRIVEEVPDGEAMPVSRYSLQ